MIHKFTAKITEHAEGSFTARLAPFGSPVAYGSGTVEFAAGSIHVPTTPIALTVDHSGGALDRIGVMTRSFETTDALFGEFQLADTAAGSDVRELLILGALTDVSVGVELDGEFTGGVMEGTLDHVSVVAHGRFGKAETPSKVLSVHDEKEPIVAETMEDATATVVAYDDTDVKAALAEMADKIDTMSTRVVNERPDHTLADFAIAVGKGLDLAEFALATEDTTVAAGVVPDYLSSEIISIVDTARPFIASFQNDPIGTSGMSVVYPEVTAKPSVGIQVNELDEVDSTQMVVGTQSWGLATHAGANKVSVQLIERSDPSFVSAFFRELAGVYAINTEVAALSDTLAAITQTQVLADASTDAASTIAALAAANTQIINGVRRPATDVWLGATRWEEFLSLVDSTGRPIVTWPGGDPSNAFGLASLDVMTGTLSGLRLRLVPNMGTAAMIMGWSGGAANLEQTPQQLRVQHVDTVSVDMGVYGLYKFATKYPAAFVEFTLA